MSEIVRCNKGHESRQSQGDCPACMDELRHENEGLKRILDKLLDIINAGDSVQAAKIRKLKVLIEEFIEMTEPGTRICPDDVDALRSKCIREVE